MVALSEMLLSETLSGTLRERSASDEEWHSFQITNQTQLFFSPFDLIIFEEIVLGGLPPISLMTFLFNF